MEFIIMDSSVLITSCLFWKYEHHGEKIFLRQRKFSECEALFGLIKKHNRDITCVITKTVEVEAMHALKNTIDSFMEKNMGRIFDILKKYSYEILKNMIRDQSLDRLEDTIEEYSTRLPLNKEEVEKIIKDEIEVFFRKIIPDTVRYIPVPDVIKKLKGSWDGKRDIIIETLDSISHTDKILYLNGEPKEKDKRIMGEATYIVRFHNAGKNVFIAALDYHFIPNPIQIESFLSPLYMKDYKHVDSRMRDILMGNFGFFGDRPKELLLLLSKRGFS